MNTSWMRLPSRFARWGLLAIMLVAAMFQGASCHAQETLKVDDLSAVDHHPLVFPNPRHERYLDTLLVISDQDRPLRFAVQGIELSESRAVSQGLTVLEQRLNQLQAPASESATPNEATLLIELVDDTDVFLESLQRVCPGQLIQPQSVDQGYSVVITRSGQHQIHLKAAGDIGLFYGLITICQLMHRSVGNQVAVHESEVVDWPEVGLRIAKVSGSRSSADSVQRFGQWLPFFKVNYCGIQFHGKNSNQRRGFDKVTRQVSGWAQSQGNLKTLIYFCPFRGNALDLDTEAGMNAYLDYLDQKLAEGAAGVEIDYNDWAPKSGHDVQVVNRVVEWLKDKHPDALVLYCPPLKGEHRYHGAASPALGKVLSQMPDEVLPVWTGFGMLPVEGEPLADSQVKAWTSVTGRRPLFWANRVSPVTERYFKDKPIFVRPIDPGSNDMVFNGELLPRNLGELFEGVHLNCGEGPGILPEEEFAERQRVCLATAADFLWNPHPWEAEDSLRRAKRFVKIFRPIIESSKSSKGSHLFPQVKQSDFRKNNR